MENAFKQVQGLLGLSARAGQLIFGESGCVTAIRAGKAALVLVDEIEAELQNSLRQEVESTEIGEMVMQKLKERDQVAYVRFASVYREFKDIDTFLAELNVLKGEE